MLCISMETRPATQSLVAEVEPCSTSAFWSRRPCTTMHDVRFGRGDQNAGSTSATSDWVAGLVSIEMHSIIFTGTTCSPYHVDPSSGLHCHFAFKFKKKLLLFEDSTKPRPVKGVSSSKFVSGFDSMTNLTKSKQVILEAQAAPQSFSWLSRRLGGKFSGSRTHS